MSQATNETAYPPGILFMNTSKYHSHTSICNDSNTRSYKQLVHLKVRLTSTSRCEVEVPSWGWAWSIIVKSKSSEFGVEVPSWDRGRMSSKLIVPSWGRIQLMRSRLREVDVEVPSWGQASVRSKLNFHRELVEVEVPWWDRGWSPIMRWWRLRFELEVPSRGWLNEVGFKCGHLWFILPQIVKQPFTLVHIFQQLLFSSGKYAWNT